MLKLGTRAWKVTTDGGTGIVFADSRGRAKMVVARVLHEMCGYTMSQALKNTHAVRAKDFDGATYCGKKPNGYTSYNPEYLEQEASCQ